MGMGCYIWYSKEGTGRGRSPGIFLSQWRYSCLKCTSKLVYRTEPNRKLIKMNKTSASARRIDKRGGAVKTVQHPPPLFSRAISPSLIVCLYLAYSKLLKLTTASNAGAHFTKYRSITAVVASIHTCDKQSGRRHCYTHNKSCGTATRQWWSHRWWCKNARKYHIFLLIMDSL